MPKDGRTLVVEMLAIHAADLADSAESLLEAAASCPLGGSCEHGALPCPDRHLCRVSSHIQKPGTEHVRL